MKQEAKLFCLLFYFANTKQPVWAKPISMTKLELIYQLESTHNALETAIAKHSVETLTQTNNATQRSIKDALAQRALWKARIITLMFDLMRMQKPSYPTPILELRAELDKKDYELQKDRPIERVLADLRGSHEQMLKRLGAWHNETELLQKKVVAGKTLVNLILDDNIVPERELTNLINRLTQN